MARYYGFHGDWEESADQCLVMVSHNFQCSRQRSGGDGLCGHHTKQVEKGGIVTVPKTDGFPRGHRTEVIGIDDLPLS